MVSTFHYVQFRTFAHATEDEARVRDALVHVIGDPEVDVNVSSAEGHHGNPILLLEAELKNRPTIDAFFHRVAEDPHRYGMLVDQMERRLDDNNTFYLRFAKQPAYRGDLVLAQEEDAVLVRAKVAAFPAKRERAVRTLGAYLTKLAPRT